MTKEEIQQGYHDHCKVDINTPKHLQTTAYYTHDGWMQGAEWMQEQMINNAWKLFNMPTCGGWAKDSFFKAIKGE